MRFSRGFFSVVSRILGHNAKTGRGPHSSSDTAVTKVSTHCGVPSAVTVPGFEPQQASQPKCAP